MSPRPAGRACLCTLRPMEPARRAATRPWTADDVPDECNRAARFREPPLAIESPATSTKSRRARIHRESQRTAGIRVEASLSFSHQRTAILARPASPVHGEQPGSHNHKASDCFSRKGGPRTLALPAPARNHCEMASIPTNTARTAPLDTSVKLGAAQQRALKDLVAMGFGKQACKEALLRTGTTSMDRLLAALTGPEEPPVKEARRGGHAESRAKT